jgi:altronate dehydratase large subunit
VEAGKRLMAGIAAQRRVEVPVSELMLAAGCGEVDQTTERAANPALEAVAQLLVDAGGTVVSSPPLPPLAGAGAPTPLAFAERPQGRGRFLIDAPAQDAVALTAKAVAGAQVCLFATGSGSPLGNAIFPVIKVCANAATIAKMEDNVDFSAVSMAEGSEDKADLAGRLFRLLLDVCNGQLTNAEIIGHQEFAIHRVGPTV